MAPDAELVKLPVVKGTFWPITILASSLSRVSKLGVDSTLASPLDCKNRASAPSAKAPLRCCPMARFKPVEPEEGTSLSAAAAAAKLKILVPPVEKLVPNTPTVLPPVPVPLIHCTPNSAALSALTSAIKLSTNTWARRWSSLSMTARNWRYCGSGAVMMSALVAGSA